MTALQREHLVETLFEALSFLLEVAPAVRVVAAAPPPLAQFGVPAQDHTPGRDPRQTPVPLSERHSDFESR